MTLPDEGDPPSFQSIADQPSTTGISLNVLLHSNHNNGVAYVTRVNTVARPEMLDDQELFTPPTAVGTSVPKFFLAQPTRNA